MPKNKNERIRRCNITTPTIVLNTLRTKTQRNQRYLARQQKVAAEDASMMLEDTAATVSAAATNQEEQLGQQTRPTRIVISLDSSSEDSDKLACPDQDEFSLDLADTNSSEAPDESRVSQSDATAESTSTVEEQQENKPHVLVASGSFAYFREIAERLQHRQSVTPIDNNNGPIMPGNMTSF
jgi:hypothetical protein